MMTRDYQIAVNDEQDRRPRRANEPIPPISPLQDP